MELNEKNKPNSKMLQKFKPDSKKTYSGDEEQDDEADKDENDETIDNTKIPTEIFDNFEYDSECYYDVVDELEPPCDDDYDENISEQGDDDAIDIEEEDSDDGSAGVSKRSSANAPNDSCLTDSKQSINEKASLSKKSLTAARWVGKKVIRAPAVRRHFVTKSFKRVNTITDWKVCIPCSTQFAN